MAVATSLHLGFESIESFAQGSNPVRKYLDPHLGVERVGKRIDLTMVDPGTLPEASTLQSIQHQNIVPIITAADVSGYDPSMKVIEIVTPYYPRGSITDALLRGERFAGFDAIAILRSALLGLRELHVHHRICHRDIKAGNILLTDPPVRALIADLGVAGKLTDDGTVPTVGNATLYSPPEFRTEFLTPASDLYSMGLILRELLGGAFPYNDYTKNDVNVALARGDNPLTPLDKTLPIWTPKSVRAVYSKATHQNPSRRYKSAKEMSDALSSVHIASWKELAGLDWEASGPSGSSHRARVTAEKDKGKYRVSLKYSSRDKWRRFQHVPDVTVDSLDRAAAQSLFTAANIYVMASS